MRGNEGHTGVAPVSMFGYRASVILAPQFLWTTAADT